MIFIEDFDFTSTQFLTHKFTYFGKEIKHNLLKFEADDYVHLVLVEASDEAGCCVGFFYLETFTSLLDILAFTTDFCDTKRSQLPRFMNSANCAFISE